MKNIKKNLLNLLVETIPSGLIFIPIIFLINLGYNGYFTGESEKKKTSYELTEIIVHPTEYSKYKNCKFYSCVSAFGLTFQETIDTQAPIENLDLNIISNPKNVFKLSYYLLRGTKCIHSLKVTDEQGITQNLYLDKNFHNNSNNITRIPSCEAELRVRNDSSIESSI